jgi:hypothetical protein
MSIPIGQVNRSNQKVIKNLQRKSDNHRFATLYKLQCLDCEHAYEANSCDLHERKCPHCQQGKSEAA